MRIIEITDYTQAEPVLLARVVLPDDEDRARIDYAINEDFEEALRNEVIGPADMESPASLEHGEEYMEALLVQYGYGLIQAEEKEEEE